jgi:hypothetical protein
MNNNSTWRFSVSFLRADRTGCPKQNRVTADASAMFYYYCNEMYFGTDLVPSMYGYLQYMSK